MMALVGRLRRAWVVVVVVEGGDLLPVAVGEVDHQRMLGVGV